MTTLDPRRVNRRITTAAEVEATRHEKEGPTIDYKGKVNTTEWWELAKDIAAFANHLGGVILVGAFEDKTTHVPHLAGLEPDYIETVRASYEHLARDRCRPSPIAVPHVISWSEGKQMLAVNVEAYPNALVGAQFYALNVNGEPDGANAWQFPVRIDDDNVSLSPEVMPMYMNASVRRTIILLEGIPTSDYDKVNITQKLPSGVFAPERVTLQGFDIRTNALRIRTQGGFDVAIPLDDIEAVWCDENAPKRWFIGILGYLQPLQSAGNTLSVAYLRGHSA